MSDSSGTGIPRQFYGGMATTTSSTSGDARRDSMSISEHMSEVCVLPSDKGISSAKCGEILEDGEEPQQGLDPFDRSAKQIATAAAAAVAAAESEADGRDVALRVDMHQKQQEENDLEVAREAIGVSKDAGGHARRDREVKEKASRKASVLQILFLKFFITSVIFRIFLLFVSLFLYRSLHRLP